MGPSDNLAKIIPVTYLGIYLHAAFLSISMGTPLVLIALIYLWNRSKNELYFRAIKTLTSILVVNFAAGAATGTLVEFGLVQAWPGTIFVLSTVGFVPFTLELIAFVGEIVLLLLFIITLGRLKPFTSLTFMAIYFVFAVFSGVVITSVNSWMNVPWGTADLARTFYPFLPTYGPLLVSEESYINLRLMLLSSSGFASQVIQDPSMVREIGKFLNDPFVAIFNEYNLASVLHNVTAAIIIGMSIILAGYAYSYVRNNNEDSLKIIRAFIPILVALLIVQPIVFGDFMGKMVASYQPTKFAAIEGLYESKKDPLLGFLAFNDPDALLVGFNDLAKRCDEVSGFKIKDIIPATSKTSLDQTLYELDIGELCRRDLIRTQNNTPLLNTVYYVKIGGGIAALAGSVGLFLTFYNFGPFSKILRKILGLLGQKISVALLSILVLSGSILASTIGWFVREVGRSPWTIYGYLWKEEIITAVPIDAVIITMFTITFLAIGLASASAMYLIATRPQRLDEMLRRLSKNE
ncbi:MAG: cytochrome ubiquinol oxidase subunit I [Nitrososphaerota archaeon]